jgi:hypothetical protein
VPIISPSSSPSARSSRWPPRGLALGGRGRLLLDRLDVDLDVEALPDHDPAGLEELVPEAHANTGGS